MARKRVEDFVKSRGWNYRQRGEQLVITTCPFCSDSGEHFSLNKETGQFNCFKCNERGTLKQLKRLVGDASDPASRLRDKRKKKKIPKKSQKILNRVDQYHENLLEDLSVLKYLSGRGLTLKTIKHFRLGIRKQGGRKWLAIPHTVEDKVWNMKFRSIPPDEKEFKRVYGCPTMLFNQDAIDKYDVIIITEGELDAMILWQKGFKNVVGITAGAMGFPTEWIDLLSQKERVYMSLDYDVKGRRGAGELAARVGYDKCYDVQLPKGKDTIEFFQLGGTKKRFQKILDKSKPYKIPFVVSAAESIWELAENIMMDGDALSTLKTPWEKVNTMVQMAPGDLIVLSGRPKVGKTTFALNVLYHLARGQTPAMLYCLEMRDVRLAKKLVSLYRRRAEVEDVGVLASAAELKNLPLYFVKDYRRNSANQVFDRIKASVRRHGIKIVCFDNLNFLCRDVKNMTAEIGVLSNSFKLLAEELEVPIILVAQPTKLHGKVMSSENLRDSGLIQADADAIVVLHREETTDGSAARRKVLSRRLLVRIDRSRYSEGGDTWLDFDGAKSLITSPKKFKR